VNRVVPCRGEWEIRGRIPRRQQAKKSMGVTGGERQGQEGRLRKGENRNWAIYENPKRKERSKREACFAEKACKEEVSLTYRKAMRETGKEPEKK